MIDKEIMDALCFLHSLARKDTEFETQYEAFKQVLDYIEELEMKSGCEHDCKDCWKFELLKTKWIPCSEKMPNTNGVYNVTRKISEGEYKFYISDSAYFDGQDTWHADNRVNHGREYLKDVIAWKELDEPYKEVG